MQYLQSLYSIQVKIWQIFSSGLVNDRVSLRKWNENDKKKPLFIKKELFWKFAGLKHAYYNLDAIGSKTIKKHYSNQISTINYITNIKKITSKSTDIFSDNSHMRIPLADQHA